MKKRGFTIMELMVVVSIIGLLAGMILVSLQAARARSRDGKRWADAKTIKNAIESYYLQNGGVYPALTDSHGTCTTGYECAHPASELQTALGNWLSSIPRDPIRGTSVDTWGPTGTAGTVKPGYLYVYKQNRDGFGVLITYDNGTNTCKIGDNMTTTWWSSAPNCER